MKKNIKVFSVVFILILCFGIFASCNQKMDPGNKTGNNNGNNGSFKDYSYSIEDESSSKYSYSTTGEMLNAVLKGAAEIVLNYQYTTYDYWKRPTKVSGSSSGSGFVIGKTDSGYPIIVTNYHVIQNTFKEKADYEIYIKLTDKAAYYSQQAKIMGYDANMDIAVLILEKEISDIDERILSWGNSKAIYRGQEIFAIGNALGYGSSLTKGIISIAEETLLYSDNGTTEEADDIYKHVIRHDASINSGNSGGVLINSFGEVIGINSYGYLTSDDVAAENMSLAIPSNMARAIYEYIRFNYQGEVVDASVAREDFNQILRAINSALDNEDNNILVVTEDLPELKLEENDILLKVNNIDVNDMFFDQSQIISPSILLELSYYYSREVTPMELIVTVLRDDKVQEIKTGYYSITEVLPRWYNELPFTAETVQSDAA